MNHGTDIINSSQYLWANESSTRASLSPYHSFTALLRMPVSRKNQAPMSSICGDNITTPFRIKLPARFAGIIARHERHPEIGPLLYHLNPCPRRIRAKAEATKKKRRIHKNKGPMLSTQFLYSYAHLASRRICQQ